jgi:hypothetical protein
MPEVRSHETKETHSVPLLRYKLESTVPQKRSPRFLASSDIVHCSCHTKNLLKKLLLSHTRQNEKSSIANGSSKILQVARTVESKNGGDEFLNS